MDLEAGENVIPVDIVGDLTPQQYIKQLLTQQNEKLVVERKQVMCMIIVY